MKLIMLSACLMFLLSFSVLAQKPPIKYGVFSKEELALEVYDLDSSAVAVVLADYGHAYINLDLGRLIFERHKRIKILKKEGLEWANASIPLYRQGSKKETVSNLKATTYNLANGKMEQKNMSKSSIFEEKFSKNFNIQKFAFEDVKVGSIIEYSYKINSEFFVNFPSWKFQSSIPVIWSEYKADVPDIFEYQRYMQGYLPIATYETSHKSLGTQRYTSYRWVIKDAPAFKEEPYMTSEDDYISKINFALSYFTYRGITHEIMGSWEKLRTILLESEYFGKVVDNSGFLNKTVREITKEAKNPHEKVKIIYDYIQKNLEWDETSDYDSYSLKDAFKVGKGSSADINLGLASMLREAGINVDLVLLSTRDHGFVRQQYAMAKQFNYVICRVNIEGKTFLLDATDRDLPQDIIPQRCLNGMGLLISKTSKVEWVSLEQADKSKSYANIDFVLNAEGNLQGKIDYSRSRYFAREMRASYKSKGEVEYLKDFISGKAWSISQSTFTAVEDVNKSVNEHLELEIKDHVMLSGNMAYLNPFLILRLDQNPFKSIEREYPVDFGSPFEKICVSKFTIPDNYVVEELPKSTVIALPENGGRYMVNVAVLGNSVSIHSNFSINKSLFSQLEYPILREFYNQVVAMQSEQIVLKKVK